MRVTSSPGRPRTLSFLAQARGVHQHAAGPAVHVELGQEGAHRVHAVALFFARHGDGRGQGRAGFFEVVGVHHQRLGQLAGGAGELAEHQHAAFVVARGDEFLGHQVHAVVQAADVAQVGGAVEAEHRRWLVVGAQEA
jgi:hypothetical protein